MTDLISRAAALLPCPFCGGEPTISASPVDQVSCENYSCPCDVLSFDGFSTIEAAIAAWNTRALPAIETTTDPRDAVIAQLVDGISFYADWDNWVLDERGVSLIDQDEGKLARAALAAAKGVSK